MSVEGLLCKIHISCFSCTPQLSTFSGVIHITLAWFQIPELLPTATFFFSCDSNNKQWSETKWQFRSHYQAKITYNETDNHPMLATLFLYLPLLGLCFAGFFCSGGADSPTPQASSSLFSCLCEILEVYTTKTGAAFWMHNLSCFNNSGNSGKIWVSSVCNNTINASLERAVHQFFQTIQPECKALRVEINVPQSSGFSVWPPLKYSTINHCLAVLYCKKMLFPWQLKLLNQHVESEEWLLFGFLSARQRYFMLYLPCSIIGRDASWIEVVTAPQADSDPIVTHSPPCLKSPHYACSTYRGDICPKGG